MHKRIYKFLFIYILILVFSLTFTACLYKDENIEESSLDSQSSQNQIVLGFSQVGAESDWRSANSSSIMAAAQEAGIKLIFSNAQQKQENQIKAIRSFIAQQVDIIAFSPIVETGWESVLNEAKVANIPVVVLDRAIDIEDKSLYVTHIGSDFEEEGRKAGRWLIDNIGEEDVPINVVELQGTVGASPTNGRSKGFEEVIKENPNIRIIGSGAGDFMRSKGKELMEKFLKDEGKNINVVFSHNDDMALGAIEAIEEYGLRPGKDIKIVSVDAVRAAFEAMIQGKLNCTVECNPLQGDELIKVVKDIINGKSVPKRIIIEERIFTEDMAEAEFPNRKY